MRVLVLLALLAGPAGAEAVKLDGAGVTKALVGVTLIYDDGTTQSFALDGGTVFDGGKGASNGRWRGISIARPGRRRSRGRAMM